MRRMESCMLHNRFLIYYQHTLLLTMCLKRIGSYLELVEGNVFGLTPRI